MRVMLFGRQGSGKTTLAYSASRHPELVPMCFVDFDFGLTSIMHSGVDEKSIFRVHLDGNRGVDALADWLLRPADTLPDEMRWLKETKTVVIDSLPAMRDALLFEGTANEYRAGRTKDPFKATQETWGITSNRIARLINILGNPDRSQFHLIVTAPLHESKGDGPYLNPALLTTVNYAMDYIFMTQVGESGSYLISTTPGASQYVKCRGPIQKTLARLSVEYALKRAGSNASNVNTDAVRGWFVVRDPFDKEEQPNTFDLAIFYDLWKQAVGLAQ